MELITFLLVGNTPLGLFPKFMRFRKRETILVCCPVFDILFMVREYNVLLAVEWTFLQQMKDMTTWFVPSSSMQGSGTVDASRTGEKNEPISCNSTDAYCPNSDTQVVRVVNEPK